MKIEHSFEVEAPIDTVWAALTDIPRVAPCLPGADINDKQDDGSYKGTFTVKLGPTTASYRGQLSFEELDESSHTVTMRGDGTDKRGQGGVKATVVSKMREENGVTHVDIDTDLNITGRLARFGRGGMVQDVSTKLLDRFAECLKADLTSGGDGDGAAAEAAPPPTDAAAAEEAPAAAESAPAPTEAAAAEEAPATAEPASGTEEAPVAAEEAPAAAEEAPAAAEEAATSEAAGAGGAAAAAASAGPSAAAGEAASSPRPPAEPFDAGAVVGEVAAERAKRAAPVLVALVVLLIWLIGRRD